MASVKKCCIETITYEVGFTLPADPGLGAPVDFYYYLHKIVQCTTDCNSKDGPLNDKKTKIGRDISWTEVKKHLTASCDSTKVGKGCECEEEFTYKGLLSDTKFKIWKNFVKNLNKATTTGEIKALLRKQGNRFCEFTPDQIKNCCNKDNVLNIL